MAHHGPPAWVSQAVPGTASLLCVPHSHSWQKWILSVMREGAFGGWAALSTWQGVLAEQHNQPSAKGLS